LKNSLYIAILTLLLGSQGQAQTNLVPNPGFEDTLRCATQINQFQGYVKNWMGVNNDYFNDSCDVPNLGVPANLWGYQYTHSGLAMAGTTTIYLDSFASTYNAREYIYAQLTDTLTGGKKYFVSFYVDGANNTVYTCNDFGASFTVNPLSLNHLVQHIVPQIQNDPINNPLTDTAGWTQVKGWFIASGGEKYITLGNFTPDSLCHIRYQRQAPNNTYDWRFAYYYIDDISVTLDTTAAGIVTLSAPKADVRVYPTPNDGNMTVDYVLQNTHEARFELYDLCGKLIDSRMLDPNKPNLSVSENDLSKGVYIYHVIADKANLTSGKIVIVK
jgi:hypothetical protein